MRFIIRGVHPVEAPEPCYLIEAELTDGDDFHWGEVTQENSSEPRSSWQVAYDEQPLDEAKQRWVFFFHYLDFGKALLTPVGSVCLPPATPRPSHLEDIEYMEP